MNPADGPGIPAEQLGGGPNTADGLFDPDTDLGRDLAAVDWAATPLGPVSGWPATLRNIVRLQLGSRFAMWMAWGPDLTFFCNEAYRGTLGAKYPWALGRPAAQVWSEIWPDIGPRIESVISSGVATWDEGLLLFLERSGYQEETYHTFSYSPITDDVGVVRGMLCVVSEDTARAIGERRMLTLRDLATALAAASTSAEVGAAAAAELGADRPDLPFCLGYVFDASHESAELSFCAGVPVGHPVAPPRLLTTGPRAAWPAGEVAQVGTVLVEGLPDRFGPLPSGAWDRPPPAALLVPFRRPGRLAPFGFLVAALNPYRTLDADYQGFIELVAGQLAAAIIRAEAFEQERRRADDLAELDRAKTAFFTNVSHELRTPLTLLLGPTTDALADRGDPLSIGQRGRAELVQRNAERLLKLVNTLLDFSRLESDRAQAYFEPLELGRYTSELAAMFDSAVRSAGLSLTIDCAPLARRAYVDREMWAKIVFNLLSNALKATFAGGITIRLSEHEDRCELSVTDTGVGIATAEQPRLFERFHRISGAELRSHEGSGIGLALVAELASLHGGTVTVTSAPGSGSTFTVGIPLGSEHLPAEQVTSQATAEAAPLAQYSAGYLAEASRWLVPSTAAETEADGAVRTAPRVLVVDDNADMREYISTILARDYRVQTATDGAQALLIAHRNPPDLVLTDVMMPNLDGFGLLTALRADPTTMHVPVVMLSARSGDEATIEGLEAGADDYLVKPFAVRELLARVRANLELDRVRRVAEELNRNRELLDQAEELAHVGSWEVDLRDNRVRASPEYFRILGFPSDHADAGSLPAVLQSVVDSDRPKLEAALLQTAHTSTPLDIELRLLTQDGQQRLVRAHGIHRRTPDNPVGFIRGSLQDITEQRSAELAVAAAAASREALIREHAIAEELQRSLLPATTFQAEHLDIASYYAAGVEGTQAGGDWYDVIDLGGERTALVIGDVMGRGVRAAAVMGQLRATVQAYARLDLAPANLMTQLDAAVRDLREPTIVTCVYAVHDANANTLTYANAGHVPPLLSGAASTTRRLEAGGPPLGTGYYRGSVETVDWEPGGRLTLYTDGLVEHRGGDIDAGIDLVIRVLDDTTLPVEALPGILATALLSSAPDDDVAILIATLRPGSDAGSGLAMSIAPSVSSVEAARQALLARMVDSSIAADVIADALLIVSELVTNAIRHASTPIELRVRREHQQLIIAVADGTIAPPIVRDMDPTATGGRGLRLIEALSAHWGAHPSGAGKSVWSILNVPSDDALV